MAARLLERIRDDDQFDLISDEIELALAHYDSQLSAMILVTILAKTIGSIADDDPRRSGDGNESTQGGTT